MKTGTILGVGIALAALIVEGRMATSREIAVLRMDTNESIAGLRRDFTSLRADVASLRGEVSKLGERVANIEGRLDGWSLAVLGAQRSRTAPDGESRRAPKPR